MPSCVDLQLVNKLPTAGLPFLETLSGLESSKKVAIVGRSRRSGLGVGRCHCCLQNGKIKQTFKRRALSLAQSKSVDLFLKANYLCQDSKDWYSSLRSLLVVETKQVPGQISGTLMPSCLGWWNILWFATTSLWYAEQLKSALVFSCVIIFPFYLTQIVFQINFKGLWKMKLFRSSDDDTRDAAELDMSYDTCPEDIKRSVR